MRFLPLCVLLGVVGCLLSPFLLTAWWRDHRGVDITGTVIRKQETVWHSTFENEIKRSSKVTVSYFPPGRSWSAYQTVALPLNRYDEIARGDVLRMRYLLERDMPAFPLFHSLYRSGFLPVASVDGRSVFGLWRDLLSEVPVHLIYGVTTVGIALWLWYKLRIPGAAFAVVICFLGALALFSFWEIPRPMAPLQGAILTGQATVQNEWTIDKVFVNRDSASAWSLDQPVRYFALEFVPKGRRESVVAADNIDAESIPNVKVGQSFAIQYEQANPRNARLLAGTRTFWKKNLRGLTITAAVWILLGALTLVLWGVFSRWRRRTV